MIYIYSMGKEIVKKIRFSKKPWKQKQNFKTKAILELRALEINYTG